MRSLAQRAFSPRATWPMLAATVAASFVLSACGSASYTYAGSSQLKMVFRVPGSWTTFSANQVGSGLQLDRDPGFVKQYPFLVGFDASPQPSLQEVLAPLQAQRYPIVLSWIKKLNFGEHDQLSLRTLRNALYPVDTREDAGQGDTLAYSSFTLPGGYWGNRLTFVFRGTTPTGNALPLQFSQIAATDARSQYQYLLVVECSPDCFQQYRGAITDILNSWRLKG
jgi:hypothetical protein